MERIRYEIWVSREREIQRRVNLEIRSRFGQEVSPVFEDPIDSSFQFGRLFELRLCVSQVESWKIAQQLIRVDGVLDVDVEPQEALAQSLDERIRQLAAEQEGPRMGGRPWKDRRWFLSGFQEATEWAIEQYPHNGNFSGEQTDIKVAVLDTGYTNHPEMTHIKRPGYNYVEKGRPAEDPLVDRKPISWASHGTSTSSMLIGYDTGINDDEHNGAFNYVNVIPFRISKTVVSFLNCRLGHAMARAATPGSESVCDFINTSHGVLFGTRCLREAMRQAYLAGVFCTAAAGSHLMKLRRIRVYPAKFNESLATAASAPDGNPWKKTHKGRAVDLCAPGVRIWRAFAEKEESDDGTDLYTYGYGESEGTTFAAPLVAAASTLWLAHHGRAKLAATYPEPWQKIEALRRVLTKTCAPFPKPTRGAGAGVLNVEDVLKEELPQVDDLEPRSERTQHPTSLEGRVSSIYSKELAYWTTAAMIMCGPADKEIYEFVKERASKSSLDYLQTRWKHQASATGLQTPSDWLVGELGSFNEAFLR